MSGSINNTPTPARGLSDEGWDFLVAVGLNLVFLVLAALILWPLGRAALAYRMAKGFLLFWVVVLVAAALLNGVQRYFRVNLYDRANAFVTSNVAVGGLVQLGWSAFAALAAARHAEGAPLLPASVLYAAGLLSCVVAHSIVSAFFRGHLYRFVNLALAVAGFVLFAMWPAAARATYGRLFDLL